MVVDKKDSVKGISGFFDASFSRAFFPFQGNIRFSGEGIFEGDLLDKFGPSKIKGFLKGDWLSFNKIYEGRSDGLKYSFVKNKTDLFKGRYYYGDLPCYGAATICRIHDKLPNEVLCNLEDFVKYSGFFENSGVLSKEAKLFCRGRSYYSMKPLDS